MLERELKLVPVSTHNLENKQTQKQNRTINVHRRN